MFYSCRIFIFLQEVKLINTCSKKLDWALDVSDPLIRQNVFSVCTLEGAISGSLLEEENVVVTVTFRAGECIVKITLIQTTSVCWQTIKN